LPGREADNSPPSSAEVKEYMELYLHFSNKPSCLGAQLNKSFGQKSILDYENLATRNN